MLAKSNDPRPPICRPAYSSSAYEMMKPSAVSFSSTTSWLMIAGSMARTACGQQDQPS